MSASGILWLINPDDELQLDAREGVNSTPPYYRKETVIVKITHAGAYNSPEEVEALIYVSNFPEGDTPREGYVEEIIEGFQRHTTPKKLLHPIENTFLLK